MKRNGRTLAAAFLVGALIASALPVAAQDLSVAFKVGAAPPPQEVYTKVNLTEPYNIIAGFTIYPSLASPDLFYYVPKPRLARTAQGRLVFRLLTTPWPRTATRSGAPTSPADICNSSDHGADAGRRKGDQAAAAQPAQALLRGHAATAKFLSRRAPRTTPIPDLRRRGEAQEHSPGAHPHPQPEGQGEDSGRKGRRQDRHRLV